MLRCTESAEAIAWEATPLQLIGKGAKNPGVGHIKINRILPHPELLITAILVR